jgi:hypothetical protein
MAAPSGAEATCAAQLPKTEAAIRHLAKKIGLSSLACAKWVRASGDMMGKQLTAIVQIHGGWIRTGFNPCGCCKVVILLQVKNYLQFCYEK